MTRFNQWFTDSGAQGTKIVNVKYFGAVADWQGGATGTDNTQAFQDAIDYAQSIFYPSVATVLYIPMGRYRIGGKLTQATQLIWRGEGKTSGTGQQTGTEIGFNHSFPGCIYLDTTATTGIYFEGTLFEDLHFVGVNQSIEQHCIYGIHGALLAQGGLNRVGFDSFTGCCIYFPAGSDAYYQNLSLRDVSTSIVGGFYGADSSLTLTCTMLTSDNLNNSNGVNTAFPQHAFFDFRTAREINMRQTIVEGGSLNSSIFVIGGNQWNIIDGLHVENGPPTNIFEIVTGGYPSGQPGPCILSNFVGISSSKTIYFNGVNNCNVVVNNQSGNNLPDLVDWGTGIHNTLHVRGHGEGTYANFTLTDKLISSMTIADLGITQIYPVNPTLEFDQREVAHLYLRGQWMDGQYGGVVTISTSGAANIGMYDDSDEGRVFEIVSQVDVSPTLAFNITVPSGAVGSQVVIAIRAYLETVQSGLHYQFLQQSGANQPTYYLTGVEVAHNTWETAMFVCDAPNTTTFTIQTGVTYPPSPAISGTSKLRISGVYVATGRSVPYLIGGGTPGKPIQWRATAAPTYGSYYVGDQVTNSVPTVGQPKGWVCTVAGSPGTWVSLGNL